jgi:membrane protease YdiL (CAAX protease family)
MQLLFMLPDLFAPFLAVLIMLTGPQNDALRKDFVARLSLRKIRPAYLPAILLIMPCVLFLASAISLLFGRSADQFQLAGEFQIMDGAALVSFVILFLAPTLEELGWRGYGVDSLRSRFGLFRTTMLFAPLWGFWHLPLFFIRGYYQNGLWAQSPVYAANFFVQVLAATILMNWIYYRNNRSITAAILVHFLFNLFSVLFQTEQFTKCILTILLLVLCAAVLLREREFFFGSNAAAPETA